MNQGPATELVYKNAPCISYVRFVPGEANNSFSEILDFLHFLGRPLLFGKQEVERFFGKCPLQIRREADRFGQSRRAEASLFGPLPHFLRRKKTPSKSVGAFLEGPTLPWKKVFKRRGHGSGA